jgi:hypothetical protein
VTDDQEVTDNNEAGYYTVESEDCVGVRTPGFWANSKWGTFWDAKGDGWGTPANEPKQAGTPGFADGELLYKVYLNPTDPDENGSFAENLGAFSKGLLIGDYNRNGITDYDPGLDGKLGTADDIALEDTIFIDIDTAKKLINASEKQQQDGTWMLGRDMVAAWLNYLANNPEDGTENCLGAANGGTTDTPREFLDAAIDWMQQFASTSNADDTALATDTNLNTSFHDGNKQAVFEFDAKIAQSSAAWQSPFTVGDDIPVSAASMHSTIDGFNNTGKVMGIEFCCDADSELALGVLSQISLI